MSEDLGLYCIPLPAGMGLFFGWESDGKVVKDEKGDMLVAIVMPEKAGKMLCDFGLLFKDCPKGIKPSRVKLPSSLFSEPIIEVPFVEPNILKGDTE